MPLLRQPVKPWIGLSVQTPSTVKSVGFGNSGAGSRLLSDYVNREQLAEVFGVSVRTIERWVRLRLIPAPLKLGRKSLFHLPAIERALAALTPDSDAVRRRR